MFALKRLLILFVIVVAAYCFWPRSSSLSAGNPERMAQLQVTVWKEAARKKRQELIRPLYETYEGQYRIPPVSALMMAFDTARALYIFHTAPDAADQEKALVPLKTAFTTLRNATNSKFDANAAARLELMIWMLRADHAKRGELTSAWADLLSLLYGCPAADALASAKKFALAAKLADEGKWDESRSAAAEAWTAAKALAPQKP
jgi:hypothetical protein